MGSERDAKGPFSRPIAAKKLATIRRATRFDAQASASERAAVAEALGLERLDALRLEAVLAPGDGVDWRLEGRLTARLAQACVVTLEPAPEAIDAPVLRLWSADAETEDAALGLGAAVAAGDLGRADLDDLAAELDLDAEVIEATPDPIDLGEVALETLRLALDPYPRAPGARFEGAVFGPPGAPPLTDEAARPFVGLAELKARMSSAGAPAEDDAEEQEGAEAPAGRPRRES